ncbi:MAG: hypothetical protein AAF851_17645 [Myxococcota bacterium]
MLEGPKNIDRRLALLGGLAITGMSLGCPEVVPPNPPVSRCSKLFERCRLPEGPLGVCEQKSIDDDRLVCNAQH